METVVKIENLVKRYKELVALDHLNLKIQEGEIHDYQLSALSIVLRQR